VRRHAIALLAVVAAASGCANDSAEPAGDRAPAAGNASTWESRDHAAETPTAAELRAMSLEDLSRLRAVIFGRHGRVFQDSTLQAWLATRPWYRPDTTFTNARLSKLERLSLDLVREAEAAKHSHIQPGDMRFHQNHVITVAMLGTHTPQDWDVLSAEVLANHGYVFYKKDWYEAGSEGANLSTGELQRYFDERYWYEQNEDFRSRELSAIERQNLDTITFARTRQLGSAVAPGMMHLFSGTILSERNLDGVSLANLRLMRNEIYARRGREFRDPELRELFSSHPWYSPRRDFAESDLSEAERANVALITRREARLHEELATRLLTSDELEGLSPADARRLRNEIYARRGRRFRDPGLQRYFASFPWYRPNDAFQESDLSETERRNAKLISQYESAAFTEG
jgi:hypothetical protein